MRCQPMPTRSRNSHEATLDILTDGSELTEPAIFLTRCDSVLIHQKKDKMEEDKADTVIYIVMLLPQRMYNEDKDDYDKDYNNNDVDYSFAIVPHVSDDFNNDLSYDSRPIYMYYICSSAKRLTGGDR